MATAYQATPAEGQVELSFVTVLLDVISIFSIRSKKLAGYLCLPALFDL